MAERETFFRHSLKVDFDRCEGCTTCMRSCPTGAIRIRGGKAVVDDNKCVDCGQCMKVCPHKAIYIQQDDFALIKNYQYRVCLVPSTFIGQFDEQYRTREIYSCLKKLGFTHIYVWSTRWSIWSACTSAIWTATPKPGRSSPRTARP